MSSIYLGQDNQIYLKQQQQLLINLNMKQAFHVLQLPQLELSEWLKNEIESNPVLEIDFRESWNSLSRGKSSFRDKIQEEKDQRKKEHQENMLQVKVSLYEHLMQQAPLAFNDRKDLQIAELIIGHLNEKGFLETPLCEIGTEIPEEKIKEVLKTIQTFDPPGIAAISLKESLSLQLQFKNKRNPLAEKIIDLHFEDLLHNKMKVIAKALRVSLTCIVKTIEEEIVPLDLHPGYRFSPRPIAAIVPDLYFFNCDGKFKVEVNTSYLPRFHIAPMYAKALKDLSNQTEETFYLRRQLSGGKWLKKIVDRRNKTLIKIGHLILKTQKSFFTGESHSLVPITMQEAARELQLHESTIARAVSNKFVACPEGMFSLRSFFHQGISTTHGKKISNHSLRELLKVMIEKEDKFLPLSDEELSQQFHKLGVQCARRTIAKYRSSLNISPASQRKKF